MRSENGSFVRVSWLRVLIPGIMLSSLGACDYTRTIEPAPMCNMSAIDSQRRLVAVPGVGGQESPLTEAPLNSVNVTDFAITNKVFVRQVAASRTATGTVMVSSDIINCTDHPLQMEARTQFYDEKRMTSEPVSAWKRVYLDPRTSNTYQESSIGRETVKYYRVEVREGR
ncbi:MAG: hypothetical protein ABT940_08230 [Alphaproteobacteria bacterium]